MRRLFVLLLFAPALLSAQSVVKYEIAFPNAIHHEAAVKVRFADVQPGTLELRMSRSSAGRYALHEFARNVYNFRASEASGKPLPVHRPNPHQWNVSTGGGEVLVEYTLYGDRADGTYNGIDATHAHLNMPATFMWARGLTDTPIEITFKTPPDSRWKIATQLEPTQAANIFRAPNLDYFMDSPTELSRFTLREFTVPAGGNGAAADFRLALHHEGSEAEADAYAELARAVVLEAAQIFGELAHYDYGTYTFIADYLPYVNGDGMEHRNSTVLASTRPLETAAVRNLGTVAHEFFHSWNVERMRPRALEPFNFEAENMSGELWFAEGFTSYYDDLILRRARIISIDRYAKGLSSGLSQVINSPAKEVFSAVEMSMQAPFVDAATFNDPSNRENTFISYYTWGSVIGLGLDLTLRTRFTGITLDDYMAAVWAKHGRTEVPYTLDDLQHILGEVTGDPEFAAEFFNNYIRGHQILDYAGLLAKAGLLLRRANAGQASLGDVRLAVHRDRVYVSAATIKGTPLYAAGIDRGDTLVAIGNSPVSSDSAYRSILRRHKPGETTTIDYVQRDVPKQAQITFIEDQRLEVVPFEFAGMAVQPEMHVLRAAWLGSRYQGERPQLRRFCPECLRAFEFEQEFCPFDGTKLGIVPKKP